jgi:superfamily II DNA or RNA helicase
MNQTILCKEGYLVPKNPKFTNIINELKSELTVKPVQNCSFVKNDDISFPVYQENDEYMCVPKYYGITKIGLPDINKEIKGETVNIQFKGKLRPLQQEIIDSIVPYIKKNDGGVLCLPCAAGKTVLSLYLASYFKVKTLVIVHKTFLLNQWKERATEFTDSEIGTIQQNKIDVDGKPIVIGMLQSIAKDKYDSDIFRDFGLVIFDEAHHAPSQYFSKALPLISCKLTIGLSATPKRSDKLEKVLYWYFGNIMYQTKMEQNNKVLVNIINYKIEHPNFKEYKLYTGDVNRPKTINKIVEIEQRNQYIVDMMKEVLIEDARKIIVLSDRVEHLKILKKILDDLNITTSDYYIGGMKQKALKIAETAQVIFATYSMASEALDIPDLNTLFMVTSRREVEQSVGRILRKINPNVRPLIYDFTDLLPSFISQGENRKKLYNKMGFEIKLIQIENNIIISSQMLDIKNNKNVNCNKLKFID